MRLATLFAVTIGCLSINAASAQSYSEERSSIARMIAVEEDGKYYEMLGLDGVEPVDLCVQAGVVAQAHLAADNMRMYSAWKKTEKYWCNKAQNIRTR